MPDGLGHGLLILETETKLSILSSISYNTKTFCSKHYLWFYNLKFGILQTCTYCPTAMILQTDTNLSIFCCEMCIVIACRY